VRRSVSVSKTGKTEKKSGNGMKAALLAASVLATAGVVFYFGTAVQAAKARGPQPPANKTLSSKSLSLPLFFEPNQGQTAPQVKFLARGSGYGLFLTADEAVLQLQSSAVSTQPSATSSQLSAVSSQRPSSSVIRMRLDGANPAAGVSGAGPLPGKSNYFIGNDPAQWRRNIPQFARVEYKSVYPGVDLVYYGDQGQLEYDFRVAPAADPNQIALSFQGASARLDSGDLLLSTGEGDVRFHAPRVYQQDENVQKTIAGCFRQLAGGKIGFTIGDYDQSRELVIDPVLSYSTYLGGSGTEGGLVGSSPRNVVKVAIDSADFIYLAGSTNSSYFFPTFTGTIQNQLLGTQNIFIAVINPSLPHDQQLVYATYLGGSAVDSLAGIAVDKNLSIYVAGTTTSNDSFPTTPNALNRGPVTAGSHGFVSAITLVNSVYTLSYSTYLAGTNAAGNAADTVTGLAVDGVGNAYVTGVTTSTNAATQANPFPASPNGYQTCPFGPVQPGGTCPASGPPQFFASKINTTGSGFQSMLYSTYFGGGYPATATAIGGGIAIDPGGSSVSMYITGTTTMLGQAGPNGEAPFPLFNAQQSCLNEASNTNCPSQTPTTTTDAFAAKINPNQNSSSSLVYSTYLGGSGNETGVAIDVDSSGNAYITGSTNSDDWVSPGTGFQNSRGGGLDAFIAKLGNLTGSVYPLNYFTYLGGSGDDIGEDIKVDGVQAAHVVGITNSPSSSPFPVTTNTIQSTYGGGADDAFVASISTTLSGQGIGDFSTYLGGSGLDQGTGVAIDIFGATYAAGVTQSSNFPTTPLTAYQPALNGPQDAFVSSIGASSNLVLTVPTTSPTPNPVAAGTQVAFTFDITNTGTDPASLVVFNALGLPTTGLASSPTAKVTSGTGSCGTVQGSTISCNIPTLAVCTTTPPPCSAAAVEVDITPAIPASLGEKITISGSANANHGLAQSNIMSQTVDVVDFTISASPTQQTINNGDTALIQVALCPTDKSLGYNATITLNQTIAPSMVTATSPIFSPTTVALTGSSCETTTLSVATVARPVNTGSLLRRGPFYAAWLPIGGLSLLGLGIGAGRKRRRWLVGAILGLIAGIILLQAACGSASSTNTTTGGTQAGTYSITITGSASAGASHNTGVTVAVN
jgi:hypothetical protein